MVSDDKNRVSHCLSPLLCPALGFAIGIVISAILPGGVWWGFAAKIIMVCYGLLGWAFSACIVQRRKLHCGATKPIEDDEWPYYVHRYSCMLMILSAMVIVATLGLVGVAQACGYKSFLWAGLCAMCLICCFAILVGEMGWGDPYRYLLVDII